MWSGQGLSTLYSVGAAEGVGLALSCGVHRNKRHDATYTLHALHRDVGGSCNTLCADFGFRITLISASTVQLVGFCHMSSKPISQDQLISEDRVAC